jgi:hypothetical protein
MFYAEQSHLYRTVLLMQMLIIAVLNIGVNMSYSSEVAYKILESRSAQANEILNKTKYSAYLLSRGQQL